MYNNKSSVPAPQLSGKVETFNRRTIQGWIKSDDAKFRRVILKVNDKPVAASVASRDLAKEDSGTIREFRFPTKDIWKFLSRGDIVTVETDGVNLPIAGKGKTYIWSRDRAGELSADDLTRMIDEGFIFDKRGRLQLSKRRDLDWQSKVIKLYGELNEIFRAEWGYTLFPAYGSMLGAIREQSFIGHDDDFDCGYISDRSDSEDVRQELISIAHRLVDLGFNITLRRTCIHVRRRGDKLRVDIFHFYFSDAGELQFPFGYAGATPYERGDFTGWSEASLAGRMVFVPANPERFLAHTYGPNWRTPDPGFSWAKDRKGAAKEANFSELERSDLFWYNYYTSAPSAVPSELAQHLTASSARRPVIVDLGCGAGADLLWYAEKGAKHVIGVDRSAAAVALASRRLREWQSARAVRADVTVSGRIHDSIPAQFELEEKLFVSRLLLNAVDSGARAKLILEVRRAARAGDILVLEYLSDTAPRPRKSQRHRYRQLINRTALEDELKSLGFDIVEDVLPDGEEHRQRTVARASSNKISDALAVLPQGGARVIFGA